MYVRSPSDIDVTNQKETDYLEKNILYCLCSLFLFSPGNIWGQDDIASTTNAISPTDSPDYVFPDLKQDTLIYDGKRFWLKQIFALVTDYDAFWQDDASLDQVGKQNNTFDLRAARIGLNLRSKGRLKWAFTFTADFQESRTRDDAYFQVYDVKFEIPIGPVNLTPGKQKEPFSYEMVGLMPALPQQERILTPFFVTRNTGIQVSGQLAGDRMTWWTGAFNDWLETDNDLNSNATNWVARVTGLPYVSEDNFNYLHLGISRSRVGNDDGMMRFSGKPSANAATKYVDTGSFPADHATEFSVEVVLSLAPFLVQAEHIEAWVDAPDSGDPRFSGTYLSASWVITGESRPYNRKLGYAGTIVPKNRYGAVELVGRYGFVDLTDGSIDGGVMNHWYFGTNWWASRQWKIGASYGNVNLDRDALGGNTKTLLLRLLWMY